ADDSEAGTELRAMALGVVGWYEVPAAALAGRGRVPDPLGPDTIRAERLVDAVINDRRDGSDERDERGRRIIWTGDHLDAARRFQARISKPAASVVLRSPPQGGRLAAKLG